MADFLKRVSTSVASLFTPAAAGANTRVAANAVAAPTPEEIAAAKTRICGLLEKKKEALQRHEANVQSFTIAENRYYVQHCGKTEANLPNGPHKPGTPRENAPNQMKQYLQKSHNFLRKALTSPIDPMKYPLAGGKRKKTQKRRRLTKRKHTRKPVSYTHLTLPTKA